nr:acyltransferase [uncultured Agathobacter sp.]
MKDISIKRFVWIDYLRCVAIICVILCHVTETTVSLSIDNYFDISSDYNIPLVFFAIGRIGVPFFVLITGFLLLDRAYNKEKRISFWNKRVIHLFIIVEIWLTIYFFWYRFYEKTPISIGDYIKEMLFLRKCDMGHMWYMSMILGLYIFIPFVSIILHNVEMNHIIFIWGICVAYSFGIPTLNIIMNILNRENVSMQLSLEFGGGVFGCYLLAGYLIKKGLLKKIRNSILILFTFVCIALLCVLEVLSYRNGITYNAWYDCIFLLIIGMCLFEFCSRLELKSNRVIEFGAKYSFGVYLTHNMVRSFIMKNIVFDNVNKIVMIVIYEILVIVISYIVTYAISKIPKIGKYILYIK